MCWSSPSWLASIVVIIIILPLSLANLWKYPGVPEAGGNCDPRRPDPPPTPGGIRWSEAEAAGSADFSLFRTSEDHYRVTMVV